MKKRQGLIYSDEHPFFKKRKPTLREKITEKIAEEIRLIRTNFWMHSFGYVMTIYWLLVLLLFWKIGMFDK